MFAIKILNCFKLLIEYFILCSFTVHCQQGSILCKRNRGRGRGGLLNHESNKGRRWLRCTFDIALRLLLRASYLLLKLSIRFDSRHFGGMNDLIYNLISSKDVFPRHYFSHLLSSCQLGLHSFSQTHYSFTQRSQHRT